MRRTDEKIKKDVIDQLYWDNRVNVANIKVDVRAGKITISGNVPNYRARIVAAEDVEMIEGVTKVENRIVVLPPVSTILPGDDEIEERVRTTLAWNADINNENIDVCVDQQVVHLAGTVDEYWKKWKAQDIVSEVDGVADVINNLSIVPTERFDDREIAKDIEQALKRAAHIEAQDITVKVEHGKATLSGVVSSWFAHSKAQKCAAYTSGVVDVENRIIVEHHRLVQRHINAIVAE